MRHRTQSDLENAAFKAPFRGMKTVEGWLYGGGPTVPADASTGWAPGASFIHSDGAAGDQLYTNEGTKASSDFNLTAFALDSDEILYSGVIPLHASIVLYNLATVDVAWQVTGIRYTPNVAQGGALTATAVKATGTATPASATTPLHTAGAIDLNATIHTVQSITLSVTTADLQLAAGDRLAIVLSGAMTVGSGALTIRGKRI